MPKPKPPQTTWTDGKSYDFEARPSWMDAHTGQCRAWDARTRKLVILAGWQSGKTDFAVQYALRQIARRGPCDAVVAAPSYPLLTAALQPRLIRAIESRGLGEHKKGDNLIVVPYDALRRCGYEGDLKDDLTIFLKHTQDAKAVEAVTAGWFVGDEVGQMPDDVIEAIDGRTSATGGDVCLISRPYFDNRFRTMCETPDYETTVVSFASWDNPGWRADLRQSDGLLQKELDRLKRSMPLWRFEMKYGGRFTKPAGAILDNWKDEYEIEGFLVPSHWKRYTFHDFGQINPFVISVAEDPDNKDCEGYPILVCYRETWPKSAVSTEDLVRGLLKTEQADMDLWSQINGRPLVKYQPRGIGGNLTNEQGWREAYTNAGVPVEKPKEGSVDVQIGSLYACIGRGGLRVTKECPELLQMIKAFSWEVDDAGEPIQGKIKDEAKFHGPAALRYGVGQLRPLKQEDEPQDPPYPVGSYGYHGYGQQQTPGWQ